MIAVFDNHVHLQINGENVLAAKRYEKVGGKIINACNLPGKFYPSLEYFKQRYEEIIGISEKIKKETTLYVLVTIGPYPVDAIESIKAVGKEKTLQLWIEATELAGKYVDQGKANAIGEIGRPHFKDDDGIWEFFNNLLQRQMEIAKDHNTAVVLHTESATEKTFYEISKIAEKAGMKKFKVVKHYSPPFVLENENYGIFPSIIASRENIRDAIKKGENFFMETDFLDDQSRKGAVMDIETVPKRYRMLSQEFPEKFEKYVENTLLNISKIYDFEISY